MGLMSAVAGELLEGAPGQADARGVVLRVATGQVSAVAGHRRAVEEKFGLAAVVAAVAKHYRESTERARMRYAAALVKEAVSHTPIGAACAHPVTDTCSCADEAKICILSPGVWHEFAVQHGKGDELLAAVRDQTPLSWREVLNFLRTDGLPGGRTLVLRKRLFRPVVAVRAVGEFDTRPVVDCVPAGVEASKVDIAGHVLALPASALAPFARDAVPHMLTSVWPEAGDEAVRGVLAILNRVHEGYYMSFLQKAARFGAAEVDLGCRCVPASLVAGAAAAFLFSSKGTFSPELQTYTRGCTTAFKRIAVTVVEDAWTEGPADLVALVGWSLASQQMPDWQPPAEAIRAALVVLKAACESQQVVAWKGHMEKAEDDEAEADAAAGQKRKAKAGGAESKKKQGAPGRAPAERDRVATATPLSAADSGCLRRAAELLRLVGSFESDMQMFEYVAEQNPLPLSVASSRAGTFHVSRLCDMHADRGIGHLLPPAWLSFKERFERVWKCSACCNPRRPWESQRDQDPAVTSAVDEAQRLLLLQHTTVPVRGVARAGETVSLVPHIDPGVLSAALGALQVQASKRSLLVILGTVRPEEEVVMRPPARKAEDPYETVPESKKAAAVQAIRERKLRIKEKLLPNLREVAYTGGCWRLEGEPWSYWLEHPPPRSIKVAVERPWRGKERALLGDDTAFRHALHRAWAEEPCDVTRDFEDATRALVAHADPGVLLRARSFLAGEDAKLRLPTPNLKGGLAHDKLQAYVEDVAAYRLLVFIGDTASAGLRATHVPSFVVKEPVVLQAIRRIVNQAVQRPRGFAGWSAWDSAMQAVERKLMAHQRSAIEDMERRDAHVTAPFFVVMDTGRGKTLTALTYAHRWCKRSCCRYLLWITPRNTTHGLQTELDAKWGFPARTVPRDRVDLKEGWINIIEADYIRVLLPKGLDKAAAEAFIVFDEVDHMYRVSQRTSGALRLAQACRQFIAQTATPMRSKELELISWLRLTCLFPVLPCNWLVAASTMIQKQADLGIDAEEVELRVPLCDAVRLLRKGARHEWKATLDFIQEQVDKTMVQEVARRAREDRAVHPAGGVLLAACSAAHKETLKVLFADLAPDLQVGEYSSLSWPPAQAAQLAVVIVHHNKENRGYNGAARLGCMVTGVYEGNGADRHQLRGRVRRQGQVRKSVDVVTVFMENSLAHMLHLSHSRLDYMNKSLQELGDIFELEGLQNMQ